MSDTLMRGTRHKVATRIFIASDTTSVYCGASLSNLHTVGSFTVMIAKNVKTVIEGSDWNDPSILRTFCMYCTSRTLHTCTPVRRMYAVPLLLAFDSPLLQPDDSLRTYSRPCVAAVLEAKQQSHLCFQRCCHSVDIDDAVMVLGQQGSCRGGGPTSSTGDQCPAGSRTGCRCGE